MNSVRSDSVNRNYKREAQREIFVDRDKIGGMKKVNFEQFEKEYLITLLEDLQTRLQRKNEQLKETRAKLNSARTRLEKMKSTVEYQRKKILELRDNES